MTDKQNFEKDINVPSKRPPYEIALMHDHILRLEEELKTKEQECEELKKIINEAKNSKLDLNTFFAIEAIVGEYQLELDQLKAENERLEAHSATLDAVIETGRVQYKALKQTLTEIKDIASINAINTCWASLTLCDECEEKQEADIQCPFIKFKMILEIIEGLENGQETS